MKKTKALALVTSVMLAAGGAAACSPADKDSTSSHSASKKHRDVDPRFGDSPQVIPDAADTGVDASARFYDSSETVVISSPDIEAQLRAASIAVVAHAPMLTVTQGYSNAVIAEVARLKATKALFVGSPSVELGNANHPVEIIEDLGTLKAADEMMSQTFTDTQLQGGDDAVAAVASLDPKKPVLLHLDPIPAEPMSTQFAKADTNADSKDDTKADAKPDVDQHAASSNPKSSDAKSSDSQPEPPQQQPFPGQSALDGGRAPLVVAGPGTCLAAVATARAWGAEVKALPYSDVRISDDSREYVKDVADQPVVALGSAFGSSDAFKRSIAMSNNVTQELPGGGYLVFPERRMVALYGHPSGPALGAMGEQPAPEAAQRVSEMAKEYQPFSTEPVVPAFEIIATVAASTPGADGDFSNEADPAALEDYVDAITKAGGYAVLDLQPGRARLLDQAKRYTELLKRPNVGLALDPEWKIGPDEQPLDKVGHVEASEVNEVSEWLAKLVRDNNLPQKALVLHQFQLQMIRDRETLNTDYPELAFVLHTDGHGSAEQKLDTWNVIRQELDPKIFMAWKNFYDEDTPLFTPQQTMEVKPRPWFVSYQ